MPRRSGRQANEPLEGLDLDSQTTDTAERMGVAEGAEPVAPHEDTPAPLTLSQRLAVIRADSFGIGKDNIKMSYFDKKTGEKKEYTIKGHTVEAVLSEMRPLLDAAGVLVVPNLFERTYSGNRCDVLVDFEWESLDDSADRRTIRWAGAGTDDGDKAFSKAGTNALKEHLKKLFLITDRDDAKEETESVPHDTGEGASRRDVENLKEDKRALQEQWAKAVKLALEKAQTQKDVQRIELDNKNQLTDATLPEVTRSFFIDLIVRRKAELPK